MVYMCLCVLTRAVNDVLFTERGEGTSSQSIGSLKSTHCTESIASSTLTLKGQMESIYIHIAVIGVSVHCNASSLEDEAAENKV